MIKLTDDLYYDETKTFEEQPEDVQVFVNESRQGKFDSQELETSGKHSRVDNYKYERSGFTIIDKFNYRYPIEHSRYMSYTNSTITVEDRAFHHDKALRVKQDSDDNARMLKAYPSLLEYAEAHNILTEIEKGYVYTYCEFLLDEHKAIFEAFNGIIQNKI